MTDTATSFSNPLYEQHAAEEAEFQNYGEVEIVATFGEPQAEYAAIRKGCALIDLPQRGILTVRGSDRLEFLNRFLTNELIAREPRAPMPAGKGVYAFLLNNKGRIVADMNVLERGDCTLLESDARNLPVIRQSLEKYVFSEKVEFEASPALHEIALLGPCSLEMLAEIGLAIPALNPLESTAAKAWDADVIVWRDDPTGTPGFFLILPDADSARRAWTDIRARFGIPNFPSSGTPGEGQGGGSANQRRKIWPAGWAAFNATRIEAGRAMFGIDFDNTVLPAETGLLDRAVSMTKGCYLGQEIVARMYSRGQAARRIVGFRMKTDALPIAGAPVFDVNRAQIGAVTSSTISPILSNAAIGLAMVGKSHVNPGAALLVAAEGELRPADVEVLPFVADSATNKAHPGFA